MNKFALGNLKYFVLAYFINEVFQIITIGPNVLRWYMSDIAFIPATVYLTVYWYSTSLRFALFVSCLVAFSSEIAQFIVGKGDWIDIGCFFLGIAITKSILNWNQSASNSMAVETIGIT